MGKIIWAIQTNLGSQKDIQTLIEVCQKEASVFTFEAIPFDTELPVLPQANDDNYVFYGSGGLTNLIFKSNQYNPGVFSSEETFAWSIVQEHYLNHMWSQGSKMKMADFAQQMPLFDDTIFVRPDYDSKAFSGAIWNKQELLDWILKLEKLETLINPSEENIIVAPVREIYQEYRLFIVDNKIATASLYKENGEMKKRTHIPNYVSSFANNLIKSWVPCAAFVMDIAVDSHLNMGVIELNSINSAGFYAADIEKFVKAINQHIENKNTLDKLNRKKMKQ
jgi:hypothetical protein